MKNLSSITIPDPLNKVPLATLAFWVIKIMSTTVGETGADYLAVNAGFGKGAASAVMASLLVIALVAQLRSRTYTPWIYWLTVVLVSIPSPWRRPLFAEKRAILVHFTMRNVLFLMSVVGTQITDALTDGLGVSLYLSTAIFAVLLAAIFLFWFRAEGTLSILSIDTRRREIFYWSAILCTFALGTAAGDLATEAVGLGFQLGVLVFAVLIAAIVAARRLGVNAVLVFWLAYILTRPLGAAFGDLLSQAKTYGGVGLGPMLTSVIFLAVIAGLVAMSQREAAQASVSAAR